MQESKVDIGFLKEKALWVRKETLNIHRIAQETRIASSLSAVEIFVSLFYGKIIKHDPRNPRWEGRDRFIISKGHGSISFYPILAELGFFDKSELNRVCEEGTFLGGIPDPIIPGYESVNGSLGHGLGVGCGMAVGLKKKKKDESVVVLMGDGELNEGSVWEAVMFAGHHNLDNLTLIVDANKICMLDYCNKIMDLDPIGQKFAAFKWKVEETNGHDIGQLHSALLRLNGEREGQPKLLVANTIKGKGVPSLEGDSLNHIKNITPDKIDAAIEGLR
jgi:transketolase